VAYLPSLTYYSSGAPDVVTFANGVVTDYGIDVRNRVNAIVTNGPGPTTLAHVDYVYDDASNIKDWDNTATPTRMRHFEYDNLNRLTSATSTGLWGNLAFTYDALGNRLTQTWDGDVTTYIYDHATNRLTDLAGAQLGAFTYDAAGRVKTEARNSAGDEIFSDGFESGAIDVWGSGIGPAGTLIYTFNNADQLEQVEEAGQLLGVYAYDGDGLRVKATTNGETVYYFRDPSGNTIAEYDTSGDLIANYLYAGGRQVAKAEPDGLGGYNLSYFHPDHLGSAVVITNDSGIATWRGDYRPFGEPVSSNGAADRYRFTGHELDTATNLTYAKARYYNARLGRFLTIDPVGGSPGSSQSWNPNVYVQNNPVNATDPDGEFAWFGAAIGAAIDLGFQVAVEGKSLSDVNWVSVGVSAASGATGVGLGNVVAKTFAKSALTRVAANAVGSAAIGAASNVFSTVADNLVEGNELTEGLTWGNVGSAAAVNGALGGLGSAVGEGVAGAWRARANALYHADLANDAVPFFSVWRRADRLTSTGTGVGNAVGTSVSNSAPLVDVAERTEYSGNSTAR
jgi:RHS repeat-associated protein